MKISAFFAIFCKKWPFLRIKKNRPCFRKSTQVFIVALDHLYRKNLGRWCPKRCTRKPSQGQGYICSVTLVCVEKDNLVKLQISSVNLKWMHPQASNPVHWFKLENYSTFVAFHSKIASLSWWLFRWILVFHFKIYMPWFCIIQILYSILFYNLFRNW